MTLSRATAVSFLNKAGCSENHIVNDLKGTSEVNMRLLYNSQIRLAKLARSKYIYCLQSSFKLQLNSLTIYQTFNLDTSILRSIS